MLLDVLKILLPLLGGGAAGALVNEWFRRRSGKVEAIPLIERVNRAVGPELEGFTLARVTGRPGDRHLEQVRNVREYQLTLRNTSTVHLQDVEIQFEFSSEDVEAWASRPALSKTAPVPVDAVVTAPWKKGFRWRIPRLPSTDSIEFSFRAVNPPSDDYEVALYRTDRIVLERSKGEPLRKTSRPLFGEFMGGFLLMMAGVAGLVAVMLLEAPTGSNVVTLADAGCTLTVASTYQRFAPAGETRWPWSGGPWEISNRVINTGRQKCTVQSDELASGPLVLSPGRDLSRTIYTVSRPKLIGRELSFGTDGPARKAQVQLYGEPQQQ